VDNHGPGIVATSGITLVQGSGFENNQGTGAIVQGSATFTGDTFSTYGPQLTGIGGYLAGGQITVIGGVDEYYGPGSVTLQLANVQGQGTLAIAGFGTVVAGPNVAVTGGAGALTTVIEAQGPTSLAAQLATGFDNIGTFGSDTAFASTQASDGIGNGGSGAGNLGLLTNYLASTFVTPAGEGTGVVAAAQSSDQEFLAKPIA
jgi:hypothetical protein